VGQKVAVVDYDADHHCYYSPVDLDHPSLLARDGLDPSESDPRFHQQMVYAVASQTIQMFEVALGRPIHWRRGDRSGGPAGGNLRRRDDDIWVLNLYPHAMQQANAYYSPQAHGIVFGYFTANRTGQGHNLPGQRVFTCLSHDIIAHEVTHAVIDGIRTYFTEPTNPDVLAFHEGFADLTALFAHFSQKEALLDTIQRTGGRLYEPDLAPDAAPSPGGDTGGPGRTDRGPVISGQIRRLNPLVQLAQQFGEARGTGRGLRSALGTPPNSDDIHKNVDDPHFRGSILVAAVFDAFFTVYMERAADLFRIHRAGGGDRSDELPGPLADQLTGYACDTAKFFFELCACSLDYCPPVDVTFGDFLRALVTVAGAIRPGDRQGVRAALMEAFRLRGIYPEGASFFSEDALSWPRVPRGTLPPVGGTRIANPATGRREVLKLAFGCPGGLTREEKDVNGRVLRAYAEANRAALGLDPDLAVAVPSFHSAFRRTRDGRLWVEMVVEVIQSKRASFDPRVPQAGGFPLRGGVTLIIAGREPEVERGRSVGVREPEVQFVIGKAITGHEGRRRESAQRGFALAHGFAEGDPEDPHHFQANFGLLHEER
jgi:hypothetical protein